MVLMRTRWLLLALIIAWLGHSVPAVAHKDHDKKQASTAAVAQSPARVEAVPKGSTASDTTHATMGEMMDHGPENTNVLFSEKLLDWLGRLHPIIVHFPIAFFPAALFTAIVGRQRPAFGKPVQFLVVAGGFIAPLAATLGWLDAFGMDPDPLLTVHRWLGTAVGVAAIPLALWAWRRPDHDRSPVMLGCLAAITAAIIVQGWYGGALVHGIDHMNW